MADTYEVTFEWPHPEDNEVIVTGTFDQWKSSIRLAKSANGFVGKVPVNWGDKILYKFIVDGRWTIHDDQPTETDSAGNVNNVYFVPAKPPAVLPSASPVIPAETAPSETPTAATISSKDAVADAAQQAYDAVVAPVAAAFQNLMPQSTSPAVEKAEATKESAFKKLNGNSEPAASEAKEVDAIEPPTNKVEEDEKPIATVTEMIVPDTPHTFGPIVPIAIEPVANAANDSLSPQSTSVDSQVVSRDENTVSSTDKAAETKHEVTPGAETSPEPTVFPTTSTADAVGQPSTHTLTHVGVHAAGAPVEESADRIIHADSGTKLEPKVEDVSTKTEPTSESKTTVTEAPAPAPSTPTPIRVEIPVNGNAAATTPPATPGASLPSTPANKHTFPSSGGVDESGGSTRSSKLGSARKIRTSIFGRLKSVFGSGEKEKK